MYKCLVKSVLQWEPAVIWLSGRLFLTQPGGLTTVGLQQIGRVALCKPYNIKHLTSSCNTTADWDVHDLMKDTSSDLRGHGDTTSQRSMVER